MPINYRTETGISQGINSFDLQQSTSTLSNDNSTQTFISFLQSSSRFIEQIAANYSSLRAGINEGGLAFVEASQGTQWLPYTVGGTYYPKGWYVWDSGQWISSKSNIAETLDAIGSGGGGSGFSGDYNDLTNKPTIPVDTNLSDGDIAALGYIKTFTDNDTQLSDADIAALGYIKTFTDTQLSDADITALGYVKTDNNTQLSDAEITALGYIKTFTNTQLSDADITALGYVKTDNDTQLSDSDIAALGYIKDVPSGGIGAGTYGNLNNNVKIDEITIDAQGRITGISTGDTGNVTPTSVHSFSNKSGSNSQWTNDEGYITEQISDADITALGYVKTSGTTISLFQVQDDGVTGQVVSNGYQNVAGFWDTPTLINSDFTFDNSLGHLTVNVAGTIEVDAKLVTWNDANNRHELYIELQKNGVSLTADAQYASRNNNQRVGGAYIMGYKVDVSIGDIIKLRTKRVGVAATIGVNTAANMTYFSAKLYS